uniref:polysaccharide deacetylase family protein n=1 Tax=uncultured Neisseria sp. TaxID=237778 RepID=UPI002626D6D5
MKKHLLLALLCAFGLQTAQAADPGHYGVICYHDIIDTSKPEGAGGLSRAVRRQYFPQTLTAERLIAHFNWLRDNGYTPVSWRQIKDARAGKAKLPAKPVLLTFDDGYLSFYTTTYPILKAFNYPAVYALVTSWLETPADERVAYGGK